MITLKQTKSVIAGKFIVWSFIPVSTALDGAGGLVPLLLLVFIFLCCGKVGIIFGSQAEKKTSSIFHKFSRWDVFYLIAHKVWSKNLCKLS